MRIKLLRHIVTIVALIATLPLWASTTLCDRYTNKSKLASGKWVKIEIGASGIYQIPYATLQNMGFDPAKVKIYGMEAICFPKNFRSPTSMIFPKFPY